MNYYAQEVNRLEKELAEAVEREKRYTAASEEIQIGVKIVDTETCAEMVVTKLKNGSNDFEADPTNGGNGGMGRGYHYLVPNWRLK